LTAWIVSSEIFQSSARPVRAVALDEPDPAGRLIPYITIRRRNVATGAG
jgi:hypothetical protein